MSTHRISALVALVCTFPLFAASVLAEQTPLPEASKLIERYVEAVGGREAVLRPASSRAVGTFEMPAAGIKGDLEVFTARPNLSLTVITIPGIGVMRSGYDGNVAWSNDPIMGPRVLSGAELDAARDQADSLAAVRDSSIISSAETVERTEVDGQACYKVRLLWKSGRESFDCYGVESGLIVAVMGSQETPMGKIEVTTTLSDYREIGGVAMPTRLVQSLMGQQQIMSLTKIEHDAVDAAAFELPAEIRTLTDEPAPIDE